MRYAGLLVDLFSLNLSASNLINRVGLIERPPILFRSSSAFNMLKKGDELLERFSQGMRLIEVERFKRQIMLKLFRTVRLPPLFDPFGEASNQLN